ncbi:MAG TPA: hypothetical protein VFW19_09695 [Allosphingosinicella sp.]|nr:hypothetical protein [Allosphingosinicella sp.]
MSLFALALSLAGCGGKPEDRGGNVVDSEAAAVGAEANAMIANVVTPEDPNDPARLQAVIDRAMPTALPGAEDAQYRNLRGGIGGAVCGEVATKPVGRAALAFRPFVINPDGLAVVAATPKLAFDDPTDFVADAWVRWCASPEELQKLAPQLRRAAAAPPPVLGNAGAEPDLPDVPPPPPSARAVPAAKPPPANVDSFFNSVQHKGH